MFTLPTRMTAIAIRVPGGPEVLVPEERPMPAPAAGEILVKVAAAGVNRPDAMQRMGLYPPPPGASDIPGLEIAGEVAALGDGVTRFERGAVVTALVAGGGYAEYCPVHESNALAVPPGLSLIEAGAIPETFFTVWHNVFERGALAAGETLLVHGGSSGIGTTAIQLAKAFIVQIAFQGSSRASVDFRRIMLKRLVHTGSTLRSRAVAEKAAIASALERKVWPLVRAGQVKPVIYRTFPLPQAAAAHALLETSTHIGKIVLTIS